MPALASALRRQLESVIVQARDVAEAAARSALQKRAVDAAEPFEHFGPEDRECRNRLRARGRQVGDNRRADATQGIEQLTQELAYEYWHRMLFARFLSENHLLMHPDGVAVSLEECDELAPAEGAPNGFVLAARYAGTMLPQIFRTDDVLLEIELAPEHRLALERLLAGLPRETFLADDSLGWVYQFWQTKKKDEVNKGGEKIDGHTLPTVTQLFTEHYMVKFLLHNTIGAWWCARHGINGPAGGAGVPAGQAPVEMEYLRWWDDGTPAAGTFDGWPRTLAEFTLMDPCCGSGHFLVSAFNLLVPLRIHDEGLSAQEACKAVLQDNLVGLELDPRCTQIAAFALALVAWKSPGEDGQPLGYRPLPPLNIACSGQGVIGKREEWQALANEDRRLRFSLGNLFDLFEQAPHLGSLINPRTVEGGPAITGTLAELQPLLAKALAKQSADPDFQAIGVAAQGIARAAELLATRYTLVITNVPYLGRGKQADVIKQYLDAHYTDGRADLSTAFILRCKELCRPGGSTALVTPQNWLFLTTYKKLREHLLNQQTWNALASLGEEAWWSFSIRGPRTILQVLTASRPDAENQFFGIDVSTSRGETPILLEEKALRLADRVPTPVQFIQQANQLRNPDAIIRFGSTGVSELLGQYADTWQGIVTCDDNRFLCCFWEIRTPSEVWLLTQQPPYETRPYTGRSIVVRWENDNGSLRHDSSAHNFPPRAALSRPGVAVQRMNEMNVALLTGEVFGDHVAPILPKDQSFLPAIWCYALSGELRDEVRKLDNQVKVAVGSLLKVPFDLSRWQAVATEMYPKGLPEPHSDDPTQWLFKGDIATSTDPLQVAVARLLGYRWPDQPAGPDAVDKLTVGNGIVCLPGVRGEPPGAERLPEVLRAGYGDRWSDAVLGRLLTDAGCKAGTTPDDWLRTQFFDQHCKRFHQRPFIWHIWDGRKDGFSCLVNYHKLNHKALENLTYSHLGDWIAAQAADARAGKTGADLRLAAAQQLQEKLKLILAGEPPYDIFARWKPLSEQPIGWNPDLNDGVRMNIRPFVKAGVLRKNPNIKWTKDRGKEQGGRIPACPD